MKYLNSFSTEIQEILYLYLTEKLSVTEILLRLKRYKGYEGYDRTVINKFIKRYASLCNENKQEVIDRRNSDKGCFDNEKIVTAYTYIMTYDNDSLKNIAEDLCIDRDVLKNKILSILLPSEAKEFREKLLQYGEADVEEYTLLNTNDILFCYNKIISSGDNLGNIAEDLWIDEDDLEASITSVLSESEIKRFKEKLAQDKATFYMNENLNLMSTHNIICLILSGKETPENIAEHFEIDSDRLKKLFLPFASYADLEKSFFDNKDEETKRRMIFEKLNRKQIQKDQSVYPTELLDRRLDELITFFNERNKEINVDSDKISKDDVYAMAYNCPTLLSKSLNERIEPIIKMLDDDNCLGINQTSKVVKKDSRILEASSERINLQIKILKDSHTLKYAINKPIIFRISPEGIYALTKEWEYNKRTVTPFVSRFRLHSVTGHTLQELENNYKYRVKRDYGDDPYFDRE